MVRTKASFARWTADGGCPHIALSQVLLGCKRTSHCPPLSRPVDPSPNQHQRSSPSDHFEHRQRLVRLIRLRNQRQRDRQCCCDKSHGRHQFRHSRSAWHSNHICPCRFTLQLDHRREQIQIRNEVRNHAHADQNVVR